MDGVETGVLLSEFAQQLRCKNADNPDIYFTLVDAAAIPSTLVLNQNATTQERGSWILFKNEHPKLQRLYTQGRAANGFVRKLVKTIIH